MRRCSALPLIACVLVACARLAFAQESAPLIVSYDPNASSRGTVRLGNALDDRELESAVRSGLPLRIRFRAELWRDAFIDETLGAEEWTVALTFDPLSELYIVRMRNTAAKAFTTYREARAYIEVARTLILRPAKSGRYYYTAAVDIETLSLSDFEELERWLKGELQPAVAGDRSIPGALGQGARRLFMRVLSLPERRFEARSPRFRIP